MSNTHGIADFAYELQSTCYDLLPACITSTSWPTVPVPPSLTLAAFATAGYVTDGASRPYVAQPAQTVTLSGGDGTYWIALTQDTWSTYATWNRTAGSHYVWKLSASRPPDVDGVLVALQLTVSGGAITAVTPASGVTRAERWRTLAGLGTMATQDAGAVAITGGTVATTPGVNQSGVFVADPPAGSPGYGVTTNTSAGTSRLNIRAIGTAPSVFVGSVGIGAGTMPNYPLEVTGTIRGTSQLILGTAAITHLGSILGVQFARGGSWPLVIQPSDSDTGGAQPVAFLNVAGTAVGTISTSATVTAYNTSSDARIKHAVQALAGALAVVAQLRPVTFRWNADDSQGHGFLAHELQQVVPEAVTGESDALNDDGSVKPQQVDHSKLVPWLTAACQELAQQVQALAARVTSLEEQLGL